MTKYRQFKALPGTSASSLEGPTNYAGILSMYNLVILNVDYAAEFKSHIIWIYHRLLELRTVNFRYRVTELWFETNLKIILNLFVLNTF